jgi:hypothetical protein
MKLRYNDNWDGLQRKEKPVEEAKDPTKQQIATNKKSSKPAAAKQDMIAKVMNMREDDGDAKSPKPVLSSKGTQKNINRVDSFIKAIESMKNKKK